MNPPDLDDLLAKANAATQGPWESGLEQHPMSSVRSHTVRSGGDEGAYHVCDCMGDSIGSANSEFISAANPEMVTWLVERVRELEKFILDTSTRHAGALMEIADHGCGMDACLAQIALVELDAAEKT